MYHMHALPKWDDLGGGWAARSIDHTQISKPTLLSISSPGSGFIGMIAASAGRGTGGFCSEKSCLTVGKAEGVMEEKN